MLAPSFSEQYRRMNSIIKQQKAESHTENISRFGTARVPSTPFTSESDRIRQAKKYMPQIIGAASGSSSSFGGGVGAGAGAGGGGGVLRMQNARGATPSYTPSIRPANLASRGRFAISMDGRPQRGGGGGGGGGRASAKPAGLMPSPFVAAPAAAAAARGAILFRYHVEPGKNLSQVYHQVLAQSGGVGVPSPDSANVIFLSQQSCRAIMEVPIAAKMDLLPDARIAYLSGESVLIDHVLREEMRRASFQQQVGGGGGGGTAAGGPVLAMSEMAVSYRRTDPASSIPDAGRWLVRPRAGPLGPMCRIQEMISPVWYNPEAVAIRLPHDMYQEQDFFTVLRTAVLVCATGRVYLSPEGEILFYDANDFSRPPRQQNLRAAGISTAEVFGDGLREIFRAFFLAGPGSQQVFEGQFQIFWIDALTRKNGGRIKPWWIDVHAVLLSPARRSMFVSAAEGDRARALRGSGKSAVKLAKSIVQTTSDHLDMAGTAAMLATCVDCLLRPNSSMLVLDLSAEDAPRHPSEGGMEEEEEEDDEAEEEEDEGADAGRDKRASRTHAVDGTSSSSSKKKTSSSRSKRRRHSRK